MAHSRNRSRWLFGAALLAAVVVASRFIGERHRVADLLRAAQPAWLVAMAVLQGATYLCLAAGWGHALERVKAARPRLAALTRIALAELFTDQVLPSGGMSGTSVVLRAFARRKIDRAASLVAVVTSFLAFYLAQAVAVLFAAVVLVVRGRFVHFTIVLVVLAAAVTIAVPSAVVLGLRLDPRRLPARIAHSSFVRALAGVRLRDALPPGMLLPVTAARLTIVVLDGLTLAAGAASLGQRASIDTAIVAFTLGTVVSGLSFLPGSLGSLEAITTSILAFCGLSVDAALGAVLLARAFTFWLPIVPGFLCARAELRAASELLERSP